MQTTQLPNGDGLLAYVFNGAPPSLKVAAISMWDYAHADGEGLNRRVYGDAVADHIESHHKRAIEQRWIPDYAATPWKMAFMAGHNPANWRASGDGWRTEAFKALDTIVTMTPNMSVTAMYSDYVLPICEHYERQDIVMEGRTPYAQVIDEAVPPLGDSVDDWTAMGRLLDAISARAKARGIAPIEGQFFGNPVSWDYSKVADTYRTLKTPDGKVINVKSSKDVAEFMIGNTGGMSKVTFDGLQDKGFIRVDDADDVQFGPKSAFSYTILSSVNDKMPYGTLTGRQQFYFDHDWFLQEGEALPTYRRPLEVKGYGLRLTMGHARHGIHSQYRDDSLLVALQRGEPDVFVNPDDADERSVVDGDLIRVYNDHGSFVAMAHVSSSTQPGSLFMYHGWDPMMFRGRENFSSVIPTGGLIKPVQLVGGYGHIQYKAPENVPNQTYHDTTCEFEKVVEA